MVGISPGCQNKRNLPSGSAYIPTYIHTYIYIYTHTFQAVFFCVDHQHAISQEISFARQRVQDVEHSISMAYGFQITYPQEFKRWCVSENRRPVWTLTSRIPGRTHKKRLTLGNPRILKVEHSLRNIAARLEGVLVRYSFIRVSMI